MERRDREIVCVLTSESGEEIAKRVERHFSTVKIIGYHEFIQDLFHSYKEIIFIGATGICVRKIAPFIEDKSSDPAVVCIDSTGKFAIALLSGHLGGANMLCREVASLIGAIPVITTLSDRKGTWALDLIGSENGWKSELLNTSINEAIFKFIKGEKCAIYCDIKESAAESLLTNLPDNVEIVNRADLKSLKESGFKLLIAISYRIIESDLPTIIYRPKVLHLGVGCRKNCDPAGVAEYIESKLCDHQLSPLSIKTISTIDIKQGEPLLFDLCSRFGTDSPRIFNPAELAEIETPNSSKRVLETTGSGSVCEAASIIASQFGSLVLEKQKHKFKVGNDFTFAVALERGVELKGRVEIVGAGPGDPELISVRGKRLLENADVVLYAGSLVPIKLTEYAPAGAIIRSSADMTLDEQLDFMKSWYDKGKRIVRLHTGDPCIFGAIQEQMAFFDQNGMEYRITPGISSFLAAAAALKSQFTIPEKSQTIILTRGEGRTPVPERESLHKLAKSQSTMCIFLSATLASEVERELLTEYPPDTPIAVCHKLTWPQEKICRGVLSELSEIVKRNNFTLTTMIVVGESIGNREGLSKLYSSQFSHLFRQ